jgi:hypothetical protein
MPKQGSILADGRRKNGGKRIPSGGRPRWVPTATERRGVREWASLGYPQDVIGKLIGVSESTLKRRCPEELHLGRLVADAKVAQVGFQMAVSGEHPKMTIWWMRTRMGW